MSPNQDRLANAGAAEQAGLAAADVGLEKVDGLDASLNISVWVVMSWNCGAGRWIGYTLRLGDGGAVDRLAGDVPHAAEGGLANGHHHGRAGARGP